MNGLNTCSKCKETKLVSAFYKSNVSKNGLNSQCKACMERDSKRWREQNHDKCLAMQRAYRATSKGKANRARLQRAFAKTPKGKAIAVKASRVKAVKSPLAVRARCAVSNAIRDGHLIRQPCEACGEEKSQAHHTDYSKPLDVQWLCFKCHKHAHGQVAHEY